MEAYDLIKVRQYFIDDLAKKKALSTELFTLDDPRVERIRGYIQEILFLDMKIDRDLLEIIEDPFNLANPEQN